MKKIFFLLIIVMFAGINSCNNQNDEMSKDISNLVTLEKKIISDSKQFALKNDSILKKRIDSLSNILKTEGKKLREKYRKADKMEEFQKMYKKIKAISK